MLYENHKIKLLIPSILFLLMGIAFMVYPAHSMLMLVRITGCVMILLGILIFIPTLRDRAYLGFRFGLLVALTIVIAVFGVILLVMPDAFVEVFWITLGIILILDGLKNLMYLSVLPFRVVNIVLSVLSVICGVLILIHPFGTGLASMVLIGAFFTYSGAAGIALSIISKIKGKKIENAVLAAPEDAADGDAVSGEPGSKDAYDSPKDTPDDSELFGEGEADPYERSAK